MAKVTRSLLKGLVKECLVEILAEGLASSEPIRESRVLAATPKRRAPRERTTRKHPTNFMEVNTGPEIKDSVKERINSVAGGNDVMRDILADTAHRTLPNMVAADNRDSAGMAQRQVHGDTATKIMADADPMDLFEGSSNWATLAFTDAKASTNS